MAAAARPSREGRLWSALPPPLLPRWSPTPPSPHPPPRPQFQALLRCSWTLQEVRASECAPGPGERMRTVESRGEGGREVKAGDGPGTPGGQITEGGRDSRGQRKGVSWLLVTHTGGISALLGVFTCRVRASVAERSSGQSYPRRQMTFRPVEFFLSSLSLSLFFFFFFFFLGGRDRRLNGGRGYIR